MGRTKPELPQHILIAQKALEDQIDYHFNDNTLLVEAMTHPSITGAAGALSDKSSNSVNNQRLEFLGDRVINLIIADTIFTQVADEREGVLTRLYHDCVDNVMMTEQARALSLGDALLVQENTGLATNDKVLADALEALIGAIWRDGGYDEARRVVLSIWQDKLANSHEVEKDAKSLLQEYGLKHFAHLPEYAVTDRKGPDHQPEFTVTVTLDQYSAEAKGGSRRLAEQHAAHAWLDQYAQKQQVKQKTHMLKKAKTK
ncbi:MAG: ribonuclease III [Alphaproteobacteria bacterium]|nr:ribonuclease III [Alphaproteobacteria bacterium]